MTEPSMAPEKTPDVAETVSFLRRFADLMANGYNAAYLRRASDLLETLTARVIASSDEDELWRYKYETLSRHTDELEAECEALKNDVEGHLDITASVLAERDALGETLQARETELTELRVALSREREERAAKSAAHEEALAGLRLAFDQKRETLQAVLEARVEECDGLRRTLERERDESAAESAAHAGELSGLRVVLDRERGELQARLKAREDELALLRAASEHEHDSLKEKVAGLEAKRAELRTAFDRINYLRDQAIEPQDRTAAVVAGKSGSAADPGLFAARRSEPVRAAGEVDAVVPKTTLLQARAQFEYLAREFIPLGDIASQVMCELGAYTMDLALVAAQPTDHLPVGEVARSILAPLGPHQS